jgi:hypothetical protein
MKGVLGVLPWLVRWACCAGTRNFCPALAALVGPVQKLFFLTEYYLSYFIPITQQAWQAAVLLLACEMMQHITRCRRIAYIHTKFECIHVFCQYGSDSSEGVQSKSTHRKL